MIKRFLLTAIVLSMFCTSAYAANEYLLAEHVSSIGIAQTALVQGDDLNFTCCVGVSDNTTQSVTVEIDGSIMTDVWSQAISITANIGNIINNNGNCGTISLQPYKWLRAKIQTITGGTSPKVTVRCRGMGYYK